MMNIQNLLFPNGLVLAPMAGVTDRPFRRICRRYGAELTVTEMISAKALCHGDVKTRVLAALDENEVPAAVQIFGAEPETMAHAAQILCDSPLPPALIDINMGCPMKKIVQNGEGSRLMQNPLLAAQIVRALKGAVKIPITVKFRTGWDDQHRNAVELAKILEDAGADALTVHGRTREQMYAPGVDRETIAAVKSAVSVPVIGNGDITCAAEALSMFAETGVDGIAVGRGSMGNPWIFQEISCALRGESYRKPNMEEKIRVALQELDSLIAEKGERVGICEGRRRLGYYIAGCPGSATTRDAINRATDRAQIEQILLHFLEMQVE